LRFLHDWLLIDSYSRPVRIDASIVMAGLVPAIPIRSAQCPFSRSPGHKGVYARLRGLSPAMTLNVFDALP
jgi:hypothetical protein